MNITTNLFQALTEMGTFEDSTFPGVTGVIKEGVELRDPGTGEEAEKQSQCFQEEITLDLTDKYCANDLYDELKEKYQEMLDRVRVKVLEGTNLKWVMSKQSYRYLPLDAKAGVDYFGWGDPHNHFAFNIEERINSTENKITLWFHFNAWPCFNYMEAERKNIMKPIE